MLSTIVFWEDETHPHEGGPDKVEILVRTLASLVTANVEGLLRDVAIAGPHGRDLAIISDHAGCGLIEAGCEADWLRLAIEASRGPDVLLLRSGRAPELGFIEEAGDFLAAGRAGKAGAADKENLRAARLGCAPETFIERLLPQTAPAAGLIAPRALCLRAPTGGFARLVSFVRPAATLRTQARRIG